MEARRNGAYWVLHIGSPIAAIRLYRLETRASSERWSCTLRCLLGKPAALHQTRAEVVGDAPCSHTLPSDIDCPSPIIHLHIHSIRATFAFDGSGDKKTTQELLTDEDGVLTSFGTTSLRA